MDFQVGDKIKWISNGKECRGCFLEDKGDGKVAAITHKVGPRIFNQEVELNKSQIKLDI